MDEQPSGGIVDGIDLYADVDTEFPAEDVAADESGDLYDDVLTSNVGNEEEKKTETTPETTNHTSSGPLLSPVTAPGVSVGLLSIIIDTNISIFIIANTDLYKSCNQSIKLDNNFFCSSSCQELPFVPRTEIETKKNYNKILRRAIKLSERICI